MASPAIVNQISREQRLLRSLVENMARRPMPPLALIDEIERLKAQGYTNVDIGRKLDMDPQLVGGYLSLKNAREDRLLDAAVTGRIPITVAIEISRANTPELQRELLKAYETHQLNGVSIRTVKRLIDQRRLAGRERGLRTRKTKTTADDLVSAYRRESQKQKVLIKKARLCEARLTFVITAFNKLLGDENYLNLLRGEALTDMPKCLYDRLTLAEEEIA